jgi:hypothetical protein
MVCTLINIMIIIRIKVKGRKSNSGSREQGAGSWDILSINKEPTHLLTDFFIQLDNVKIACLAPCLCSLLPAPHSQTGHFLS